LTQKQAILIKQRIWHFENLALLVLTVNKFLWIYRCYKWRRWFYFWDREEHCIFT